jgi:hypothetical protein
MANDGIELNAAMFFKLLFATANMNKSAVYMLVDQMMGLFRGLPEGEDILQIFTRLVRSDKRSVFPYLGGLVKSMVTMNNVKLQLDPTKAYSGLKEKMKQAETMMKAVVKWMEGMMLFLDKEKGGADKQFVMKLFKDMAQLLEQFRSEMNPEKYPNGVDNARIE